MILALEDGRYAPIKVVFRAHYADVASSSRLRLERRIQERSEKDEPRSMISIPTLRIVIATAGFAYCREDPASVISIGTRRD